jgi:cytochrome b involved in lipid metabolism
MAKTFTLADIAQHNKESDCYVVVHGKVYDVTEFLDEHPGGEFESRTLSNGGQSVSTSANIAYVD